MNKLSAKHTNITNNVELNVVRLRQQIARLEQRNSPLARKQKSSWLLMFEQTSVKENKSEQNKKQFEP